MSTVTAFRGLAGTLGVFFVVALSGCASTVTVFDREPLPADQLPADAGSATQVDSASTRLLWVDGDMSYFAARSLDEADGTCIVVVEEASSEEYPTFCSTSTPFVVETDDGRFALGDVAPGTEWEQLADSFWRAP